MGEQKKRKYLQFGLTLNFKPKTKYMTTFSLCLPHKSLPDEAVAFIKRGAVMAAVQYQTDTDFAETDESYSMQILALYYGITIDELLLNTY